jgi:ketosteroid isomerase-like protein
MGTKSKHRLPFSTVSKLALILVVSAWGSLPAHAFFPHHDNLHKEIDGLEMEWRQAQLSNNLAVIDRLLADDYLGISAVGTLETKADVLAEHRAGKLKITQLYLSDVKIRIYGDTAVVTSKAELRGENDGRDVSGRYRYTRVYNDRGGQWKIVSFESSQMRDPDERQNRVHSADELPPQPLPQP